MNTGPVKTVLADTQLNAYPRWPFPTCPLLLFQATEHDEMQVPPHDALDPFLVLNHEHFMFPSKLFPNYSSMPIVSEVDTVTET